MDPIKLVAILGLVAGVAYLVLGVVAYARARGRARSPEAAERTMFKFEEPTTLVEGEATDDRMRKMSALAASIGRRVFGSEFDYSAESVATLDRVIVAGWGGDEPASAETVDPSVILAFGGYLGEVLVRRTRGRWVTGMTETDPANVFFLAPAEQTVSVSPFLLIREKFAHMYSFDLAIAFTALEQKLKELKAA